MDFYKFLLKEKIIDLLNAIHSEYPTVFLKKNVREESTHILKKISINYQQSKITRSKLLNKKNKLNNSKNKIKLPKKNTKIYEDSERCQARVWGTIKYFKDGSIQYGSRCKKCKHKDSNYCYIHEQKLSHGNFKTIPNKMIKTHFEKNSTIEKNF